MKNIQLYIWNKRTLSKIHVPPTSVYRSKITCMCRWYDPIAILRRLFFPYITNKNSFWRFSGFYIFVRIDISVPANGSHWLVDISCDHKRFRRFNMTARLNLYLLDQKLRYRQRYLPFYNNTFLWHNPHQLSSFQLCWAICGNL